MFVVCEAATVPEDALLGRHLEPGAREYYSLRGSPEEAEERDRRYDDGTSCLGVDLKVHMCIYIFFLSCLCESSGASCLFGLSVASWMLSA